MNRTISTATALLALCCFPSSASTLADAERCLAGAAEAGHPQQNAVLTFRVLDDRTITDLRIDVSSGDSSVDEKVVGCLQSLHVAEDVKTGLWTAQIAWRFKRVGNADFYKLLIAPPPATGPAMPPRAIGKPHICLDYYPPEAVRDNIQGVTTVTFRITAEGTVSDTAVAQSSGSKLLDDASLICVGTWQYRPAEQNGIPIEIPWKVQVVWKRH